MMSTLAHTSPLPDTATTPFIDLCYCLDIRGDGGSTVGYCSSPAPGHAPLSAFAPAPFYASEKNCNNYEGKFDYTASFIQ